MKTIPFTLQTATWEIKLQSNKIIFFKDVEPYQGNYWEYIFNTFLYMWCVNILIKILLVNNSYQPGSLKNNGAKYQYEDKTTALYIFYIGILISNMWIILVLPLLCTIQLQLMDIKTEDSDTKQHQEHKWPSPPTITTT